MPKQLRVKAKPVVESGTPGAEKVVMAAASARCSEREHLLLRWIDCAKRLRAVLEEQLDELQAVTKSDVSITADFEDQIRLARAGEVEACRKYFGHVNTHKCV